MPVRNPIRQEIKIEGALAELVSGLKDAMKGKSYNES